MKTRNALKRVILAVDLKAEDPKLTKRLWKSLQEVLPDKTAQIEPVAILNREDAAVGNVLKSSIGRLKTAAERHLTDKLKEMGLTRLAPAKVIFADGSSTSRAVGALLDHAKKTRADLIAISSHSKKGVRRLFLGSFAETLSLQSDIPLLIVNPHQTKTSGKLQTVLFPTDFSPASKDGLLSVCKKLKGRKANVILFHQIEMFYQVFAEPFGVPVSVPVTSLAEEMRQKQTIGKTWCEELRKQGFTSTLMIGKTEKSPADAIVSTAKRCNANLVVMVSQTSKAGSVVLGSVTRQVIRNSPTPVWTVHPRPELKRQKVETRQITKGSAAAVASLPSTGIRASFH